MQDWRRCIQTCIGANHVIPMEFTGKAMKGYVYVTKQGLKTKKELSRWIQLCLDFNPWAKASKK
jgi:hypothetical protein